MKLLTGTILAFSLVATSAAQTVSLKTLLPQMTDMSWLAKRPKPYFKTEQASSYDRASKTPGNPEWFANGDAGKYVRVEDLPGRKEYVMADLKGPGAAIRIWSANPGGMLRFYFDGETEPRMSFGAADLLTGKTLEFRDPFAYESSRGTNLYFPLPYEKSLKITVDDSGGHKPTGMYYQIGYRTYTPGTSVDTFTRQQMVENARLIQDVASKLSEPDPKIGGIEARAAETREIRSRATAQLFVSPRTGETVRSGAISGMMIRVLSADESGAWDNPKRIHNLLRTSRLLIRFDGELCVDVPLGDFFGTAPGLNPYRSLPFSVFENGAMVCKIVMPYRRNAEVSIRNDGPASLKVQYVVAASKFDFDDDTYHFRAQWTVDKGHTRPFRDMTFLDAIGDGLFLGSNMHIANPVSAWWGEGDEKVYVDGETFPSTFGTGTEDYYGYAWCSNVPFVRAYHAQPRCDGPGNRGHTNINRWHVLDPLTFSRSLKFDMEMWHWSEVEATYARTAYWYSKPGGSGPVAVNTSLLLPPEMGKPKPVVGAIEGEKLQIVSKGSGQTEVQSFEGLSSEEQLWWRDAKEGDTLLLKLIVPAEGAYEISGNFCMATDYGIHQVKVHGQVVADALDFYSPQLKWSKITLGTVKLPKGEVLIEVTSKGHRGEAIPRNMFGLDYLMLARK